MGAGKGVKNAMVGIGVYNYSKGRGEGGLPSLRGHLIPLSASDGESIFAVRPSHTAAAQILGMQDKIIVLFHVDV